MLLCVARWCTSCGAGGPCLWACPRIDYARRDMSSHSYCWGIYVVCGFYSRMIADDNLPSVFMCFLFVISWNWTGENRFDVFFSDKRYFMWFASVTWYFLEVDFVKKKAVFKRLFHSSGILEIFFSRKWVFLDVFFIGMLFSFCVGHSGNAFFFWSWFH